MRLALRTSLDSITTAHENDTEPLFMANQRDHIVQAFGAAMVATATPPALHLFLHRPRNSRGLWNMPIDTVINDGW